MKFRRNIGFSLLETTIAVGLTVIVFTLAFSSIAQLVGNQNQVARTLDTQSTNFLLLQRIQSEFDLREQDTATNVPGFVLENCVANDCRRLVIDRLDGVKNIKRRFELFCQNSASGFTFPAFCTQTCTSIQRPAIRESVEDGGVTTTVRTFPVGRTLGSGICFVQRDASVEVKVIQFFSSGESLQHKQTIRSIQENPFVVMGLRKSE